MEVTQTGGEGLKRDYKIVVDAESIEGKLIERLRTLSQNTTMRGFRPGKVPVSLLRKLHGKNLMGEVLEETLSATSQEVLSQEDLRAAMQPKIEVLKYEEGSDLEFAMSVEILPKFELGKLSGIKLERLVVPVGDAEISQFLENLASQQKSYKPAPAKSHEARAGDAVVIDFTGRIDGEGFEGGSGTEFTLVLGSGQFIPGFEDQLEGARSGDKREVKVTFPGDYPGAEQAGKDAVFEVDVTEVRIAEQVAIDDELAKRLGLDDLAALEHAAHEQIEREYGRLSRQRLKRGLLDDLAEKYDFEVPEGMLDIEFDMIWSELLRDLEQQGKEIRSLEKSADDVRDDFRAIAERRVRLGLLLSEIGRANNIEVRQDEINRLLAEEARRHPGQEKQVFEYFRNDPNSLSRLRAPVLEDKVVDFLLEMAEITDRDATHEELMRDPEDGGPATEAQTKPAAKTKKAGGGRKTAPKKKVSAKKAKPKSAPKKKAPGGGKVRAKKKPADSSKS